MSDSSSTPSPRPGGSTRLPDVIVRRGGLQRSPRPPGVPEPSESPEPPAEDSTDGSEESPRRRLLPRRRDPKSMLTNPPKRVAQRLAGGEKPLVIVRPHPVVFLRSLGIALAWLAGAYLLSTLTGNAFPFLQIAALVWVVTLGWLAWKWWEDSVQFVVITQKRVVLITGIVSSVAMIPIGRITDFKYDRSFLGKIFGWGAIILESAGQEQALRNIEFVREPDKVYDTIIAQLYAS